MVARCWPIERIESSQQTRLMGIEASVRDGVVSVCRAASKGGPVRDWEWFGEPKPSGECRGRRGCWRSSRAPKSRSRCGGRGWCRQATTCGEFRERDRKAEIRRTSGQAPALPERPKARIRDEAGICARKREQRKARQPRLSKCRRRWLRHSCKSSWYAGPCRIVHLRHEAMQVSSGGNSGLLSEALPVI